MPGGDPSEQEREHPALEQPTRRRIYQQIGEKPGLNGNQLRRSLDISTGSLLHHLDRLEDEELIVRLEGDEGQEVIHFQAEDAALGQDERTRMLFGHPATRRVAMLILEHPGITRKQLSRRLEVSPASVTYHIKKLDKEDLIVETSAENADDEGEQRPGPRAHTYESAQRLEAWSEEVGHAFGPSEGRPR